LTETDRNDGVRLAKQPDLLDKQHVITRGTIDEGAVMNFHIDGRHTQA
jgi:hypothetical protein